MQNLPPSIPERPVPTKPVPVEVLSISAPLKKEWNPSIWPFLCLCLGVILLLLSPGFVFFAAPLFLACFVLSIIAMAKHRVVSGVLMMILVFTVAPLCTIGVFAYAVSKGVQKVQEQRQSAIASLSFEEVSGYSDGGYMYLKGRVRNNGAAPADFIKVQVDCLDKNGIILDTGETYAVDMEKLKPGGAKSFEIMTPANAKMAHYSYRFVTN
jgi:hypothetical protein